MAATSVLKSSASALFALLLGTASLLPAAATAQERLDRGERGAGRMERSAPSMPRMERAGPSQAPSWQGRSPSASPQSSWQGRPTFSQGAQAPRPSQPSGASGGWNGRPAWQGGDRGNPANPAGRPTGQVGGGQSGAGQPGAGQPGNGHPAWASNGSGSTPSWGTRNPTYVDPSRGNQGGRGNGWVSDGVRRDDNRGQWNGRGNDGRPGDRDRWNRDRDQARNWDRDRDGDRNRDRWRGNGWNNNRWASNDWRGNNRWGNSNGWNNNRWGNSNGWNNNRWGYNNNWRRWDRNGWRRDNRYDWYGWRGRNRSVFSLGFYYAPWDNWSYSRFNIGVVIGAPFYAERYWIADPWAYRLPPANGPYRWVRYYNDALLVDLYSGEVVDAVYDIFW